MNHKLEITPDATFGVYTLQTNPCEPISDITLNILLLLDNSFSMSEIASNTYGTQAITKMQYIQSTVENMLQFLSTQVDTSIYIEIATFDDKVRTLIPYSQVTQTSVQTMMEEIRNILPDGNTHMENALRYINSYTQKQAQAQAQTQAQTQTQTKSRTLVIMMTDGCPTSGCIDIEQLTRMIPTVLPSTIHYNFIGVGHQHDSVLLSALCDTSINKNYYFLDQAECAGHIYGEILHKCIYHTWEDAQLTITGGTLYNFRTNQWVSQLAIGDIISDSIQTWCVTPGTNTPVSITVSGIHNQQPQTITTNAITSTSLQAHQYRLETLQLLYQVQQHFITLRREERPILFIIQSIRHPFPSHGQQKRQEQYTTEQNFLSQLANLLERMQHYVDYMHMQENDEEQNFVLHLCEDVQLCMKTMKTMYGAMYTAARFYSQGAQRQYAASYLPNMDDDDDDHETHPTSSALITSMNILPGSLHISPYASTQAITLMRQLSTPKTPKTPHSARMSTPGYVLPTRATTITPSMPLCTGPYATA